MLLCILAGCGRGSFRPGEIFDAGPVVARDHETVTHVFRVRNTTGRAVKVLNIGASCDCLTKRLKKDTLAAGEATELELSTAVSQTYHPQHVTCTLTTDHPRFADWSYSLRFTSIPRIQVRPDTLSLGSLKFGDFDDRGQLRDGCRAASLDVDTFCPEESEAMPELAWVDGLTLRLTKSPEPSQLIGAGLIYRRYKLTASPVRRGDESSDTQFRSITLRTADGSQAAGTVSWQIEQAIGIAPSRVHFGSFAAGESPPPKRFELRSIDDRPFVVRSVESTSSTPLAKIRVAGGDPLDQPLGHRTLDLALDLNGDEAPLLSGTIRVATDDPRRATIDIPWSAMIRRP